MDWITRSLLVKHRYPYPTLIAAVEAVYQGGNREPLTDPDEIASALEEATKVAEQIVMRIENEDGSWEGSFAGRLSNGRFLQTYWLRGRGDYAGLTYVVTAGGEGPVWASEGLIYPGSPPPGTPLGPIDPATPAGDPPLAVATGS